MAPDRFHGIDNKVKTELLKIETHISRRLRNPMLLLEALQFPGSLVEWNDSKDNMGLRVVGHYVISLVAAAGEYEHSGLVDSRGI